MFLVLTEGNILNKVIGILIGLFAILALCGMGLTGSYNSLVNANVTVDHAAAQVEVDLQRRGDLIPNLVNTVKGYTKHENGTLVAVTEARAKLQDAKTLQEKDAANTELSSALNRLMMVQENYPELKADKHYSDLMRELAGTENRIKKSRKKYNDVTAAYNAKVQHFPTNIIAGVFGFQPRDLFQADEGAKANPKVEF